MQKFLKKFLLVTFAMLLILGGIVIALLAQKPILITPFTYTVYEKKIAGLNEASSADILIIGDQMGQYLNSFLPPLKETLTLELKRAPVIFNWARENEGLHRTLFKIKQLKKVPSIIIYHGGSSEWFENKFNKKEKNKILYNFKIFSNENIISSIIAFPLLSRLFYKKTDIIGLESLPKRSLKPRQSDFDEKELEYLYYQEELSELIDYIQQKKSSIILITTPINFTVSPKESCSITVNNSIIETQQEIEQQIKEGNFKQAYIKTKELSNDSIPNAKTFHLLGVTAKFNSDYKVARVAFPKANIFDCYNWRGNSIFNAIIKKQSQKYSTETIDFELDMANIQLQSDEAFSDEFHPQNIYYNNLISQLTVSLKKYLNLKKEKANYE